jgi:hypothetical protein
VDSVKAGIKNSFPHHGGNFIDMVEDNHAGIE